jgi:hypothetical protein
MRERYQHLDSLGRFATQDDPEFGRWVDTRLDRWALRSGRTATARKIAEKGVEVGCVALDFEDCEWS